MNSLLLEQPIYINRLYIHIAGDLDAGIFLDTLFKKFSISKTNYIELDLQDIYSELYYHAFEILKIHKKLNQLSFIIIKNITAQRFSYTINLEKYRSYLDNMESVAI